MIYVLHTVIFVVFTLYLHSFIRHINQFTNMYSCKFGSPALIVDIIDL